MTAPARRIIRLNNGFQLLFNLLWWMPVFYAYQRQAGLSDGEIFGIQSIYYVAFCLFEIPTGIVADRIGARNCLRAGAVVMTAANLAPVLAPSYTGFLVHFLAIAAGRSLTSGAASAYLYDGLRAEGADEHYLKAEGQARALGLAAKVLCWPLVGPLMAIAHAAPYVLSAAAAAGSLACAVALPRLAPHDPDTGRAPDKGGGKGGGKGGARGALLRDARRRPALRTGLTLARPGDGAGRGGLHALPHLPGEPLPARTARSRHRRELARRGAGRHDRGGGGGIGPSPVARPASVAGHLGLPAQPRAGGAPSPASPSAAPGPSWPCCACSPPSPASPIPSSAS